MHQETMKHKCGPDLLAFFQLNDEISSAGRTDVNIFEHRYSSS